MSKVAAVDIGATSGRVVLADLADGAIALTEVARFPNHPQLVGDDLVWDVRSLHDHVVDGLAAAVAAEAASCGIDTWAIDYGVVRDGSLVGPVRAYRDARHERGIPRVRAAMSWDRLYGITGIQHMAINTIYQIAADEPQRIVDGTTLLMVPDLLTWWLTGTLATDTTNASSTGMVDVRTRAWSADVLDALSLPASAFLPTDEPGGSRGRATAPS